MRGSPPVRRIFSTPSWTKRRARVSTSKVDSSWAGDVSFTPSSGMQYWPENRKQVQKVTRYQKCNLPLNWSISLTLSRWKHSLSCLATMTSNSFGSMKVRPVSHGNYSNIRYRIEDYLQILQENLKSSAWRLGLGCSLVFQQDSDLKHVLKAEKKQLNRAIINIFKWPYQSPDLSTTCGLYWENKSLPGS